MILKRYIIVLLIVITATACNKLTGPEKPKNLISKKKMVDILIDAKFINSASSKNKNIMRENGLDLNTYIYEKHNIDSLQFALSNSYYAFHVEEYEDIYTQLNDSLDLLKAELKEIEAEEWKEKTKREADSLAKALKDKKAETDSLDLDATIKQDTLQVEDILLKESIQELEGLLEPISDTIPQ